MATIDRRPGHCGDALSMTGQNAHTLAIVNIPHANTPVGAARGNVVAIWVKATHFDIGVVARH